MNADDDIRGLLGDLCARNAGDFGVAYRIAELPDRQLRCVGIVAHGGEALMKLVPRLEGTPYDRLGVTVANLPPPNRWHVRTRETLASGWLGANVWDVLGIGSQLGVMVVAEQRVWGWIGVVRWKTRAPFSAQDELVAQPPAREIIRRITATDRIPDDIPRGVGTLLVSGGEAIYRDRAWSPDEPRLRQFLATLGEPREGLERFGHVDGAVFAASVLSGPSGAAWLVRCQRAVRLRATPLLELSPKQRQVVELAARGATIAEIARAIGATENTIKTHLRRAYEACGVATRSELLELLNATIPGEAER